MRDRFISVLSCYVGVNRDSIGLFVFGILELFVESRWRAAVSVRV